MSADPLKLARFQGPFHALMRVAIALTFISHGTMKHFGFPAVVPGEGPPAFPPLLSLAGTAGLLELVGGAMILFGLMVRPVAFLLSGMMAVAYWMVHAPNGFAPAINGGEAAYLYCFIFLFLAAAGAGPYSIDAARAGAKSKQ